MAEFGGVAGVGATAQLAAERGVGLAGGDDADDVTVLLAKQGHGAGGLGLVDAHDTGDDRLGGEDLGVDQALDALKLIGGHGLEVGEVETQAVGADKGAGLAHVVAQDLLEGGVQKVGRGVVATDELATTVVDRGADDVADVQLARLDGHDVGGQAALALGVGHAQGRAVTGDGAGVTGLTTHLGVERGAVQDDADLVTGLGDLGLGIAGDDGLDLAGVGLVGVIAAELGGAQTIGQGGPHVVEVGPGIAVGSGARTLLLLGHAGIEASHVDSVACGLADLAGEVDGETVGVVQLEGNLAAELGTLC